MTFFKLVTALKTYIDESVTYNLVSITTTNPLAVFLLANPLMNPNPIVTDPNPIIVTPGPPNLLPITPTPIERSDLPQMGF